MNGAADWDFNTTNNPLTPGHDERESFKWGFLAGNFFITALFILARYKFSRLHDVICPLLVLNICWFNFAYMPFDPASPREFVFWSIIVIFRCSTLTTVLQLNGLVDLIWTFLVSSISIVARANVLDKENSYWLIMPVLTAISGCTVYNVLLAREQRTLFLLEKTSKRQHQEHLDLINLLPGGVLILNKTYE